MLSKIANELEGAQPEGLVDSFLISSSHEVHDTADDGKPMPRIDEKRRRGLNRRVRERGRSSIDERGDGGRIEAPRAEDRQRGRGTTDERSIEGGCLTRAVDERHTRERWHLQKRDELKRS
jgi:hypothetical protein